MVGKAKWKPLELPLPKNIVSWKQYRALGVIVDISVTIKDLKKSGVVIPTTSPCNSPNLACAEDRCISENDSGLL